MVSPYFFDENGNTVKNLTQWDSNQKLILESTDDITIAPKIHFCNQNSEKALVVQSNLSDGQIVADIPNTLLEEPFNITAYVYLIKEDSAKTIVTINIPVRKRPKPNDYEHKENIHVIYLTDIIQNIEQLNNSLQETMTNANIATQNAINATDEANTLINIMREYSIATDSEANEYLGI